MLQIASSARKASGWPFLFELRQLVPGWHQPGASQAGSFQVCPTCLARAETRSPLGTDLAGRLWVQQAAAEVVVAVAAVGGDAAAGVDTGLKPSAKPEFGDFQLNVAMALGKRAQVACCFSNV